MTRTTGLASTVAWWVLVSACGPDERVVALADVGTGSAAEGSSGDASTTDPGGTSTTAPKLDVPPADACNNGLGVLEFSHIWIANSDIGAVSKIDTETGVELARYRTGPASPNPDPSRTAVNLNGDVAVVNRRPNPVGVVKIAARVEDCVDRNNNGTIETSQGPDDVLDWGLDECILWHSEAQDYVVDSEGGNVWGPRPAAWDGATNGDPEDGCAEDGGRLWVGWYTGSDLSQNAGRFQRLDGSTGEVLDEVTIEQWSADPYLRSTPYGAAATKDGDVWISGRGTELALIDGQTLDYELWRGPATDFYGMAVDGDGNPWLAGWDGALYSFDRDTGTFAVEAQVAGRMRGVAIDTHGSAWIAANSAVGAQERDCWMVEFDIVERVVKTDRVELPGCHTPVGVAIDAEDFVWVVDVNADSAYKVDPETFEIASTVTELVEPYTYSDMTGSGIRLSVGPG